MDLFIYIGYFFFFTFVGTVPPGLVNMGVAKIVLKKGKKNAFIAASGACVANFFQGLIAILLAKYIIKYASIQANLLRVGVIVFAFLSVYFFLAAIKNKPLKQTKTPEKKDSRKSFVTGFFLSAINMLPIPYYIIISTQLSPDMRNFYDLSKVLSFSFAICSATFLVLTLYIIAFVRLDNKSKLLTQYANYIMAILMFLLFVVTLIRVINVG